MAGCKGKPGRGMASIFKWLLRLTGGAILLGLVVVLGLDYLLARSLPEYDERLTVDGLVAPVEIVRDHATVPHIFGQGDADTFFCLGYAHAQDRLWQMVVLRRTAQGRLSEVFGPRTLKIDKVMRRFDLYDLARSSVAAQTPETRRALEAY